MNSIDSKYPQFLKMDREIKAKFLDPLINTQSSQFWRKEQGDVYLIAAALGYKNKLKQKTSKSTDIRTYNGLRDESKLLIRIIVLSESNYDYELLKDGPKVLKIVEEYANGGMSLLYDKIFSGGADFSIEDEVWNE